MNMTTLTRTTGLVVVLLLLTISLSFQTYAADIIPAKWQKEWSKTNFSKHVVPLNEIHSGGPWKDQIPSIDKPHFKGVAEISHLTPTEPVISITIGDDKRAYPIRVLMFHEIVNDSIAGIPIAVTYCPLCNSTMVFNRRVDGNILEFGTTGKLRHSDLIMYDRQTESWWQQFTGQGIVGDMAGKQLTILPSRLESYERFVEYAPHGKVLVPDFTSFKRYGITPYEGYDTAVSPKFYKGDYTGSVPALSRVVVVEDKAWSVELVQSRKILDDGDIRIRWLPGQNSAVDHEEIIKGRDVGNIIVQRKNSAGQYENTPYMVVFAFAYHAFYPEGTIEHF